MPQFSPGQSKIAIVPATVQPSGLSCHIEVFLGPNDTTKVATSGLMPFTSSGGQQNITAPITMPAASGTYHVYIDLYVGGVYLAGYQATEDVVISSAPPFTFSNVKVVAQWAGGHSYPSPYITAKISNDTSSPITHTLTLHHHRWYITDGVWTNFAPVLEVFDLTLQPGGLLNYIYDGWGDHCGKSGGAYCDWPPLFAHYTSYFWFEDELGNKSAEVSITT